MSSFPKEAHPKFLALIGHAVLEKICENNSHILVYSPWAGADITQGSNIFININILSIRSIPVSFPH